MKIFLNCMMVAYLLCLPGIAWPAYCPARASSAIR